MGKTGTTLLRQKIFPELDRLGILHYRTDLNQKINDLILNLKVFNKSNQKKIDFGLDKFSDDSIHFICVPKILSGDPKDWQILLSNLFSYFGEDCEILITLRDPYSFLKSVYQQIIHQGESDLTPERYFLRSDLYDKHQDYFGRSNCARRYSIDELDYNYLLNFFTKKFSRVYFSDMKTTIEYKFLIDMNIVDSHLLERLIENNETKIWNKAYSKKAMFLDNKRFKILNALDLMPVSASIIARNRTEQLIFDSSKPVKEIRNITPSISNNAVGISINNRKGFLKKFNPIFKILKLPYRLIKIPYVAFKYWRFFLQNYVDKLFRYEKFELPAEMYLGKHFESNVNFYKELPLSKGFNK
jgi:hypothetical protein